jgi:LacI family transcriptional regulator
MQTPRVLIVLDGSAAWSRGMLRGFARAAHERAWGLLHYHPDADLAWLLREWSPEALVIGPQTRPSYPTELRPRHIVSVNHDRTADGIPSVVLDEEAIADAAVRHLASKGLKDVTTFRFTDSPFAVAREGALLARAAREKLRVAGGWWVDGALPPRSHEDPTEIVSWLRGLPKPCGVLACSDAWARVVARYATMSGIRVPEDLALIGVDNDPIECELVVPPISSVAIPWSELGRQAAGLVHDALTGKKSRARRIVIGPAAVVARRSSDVLAVDDPLVARAVVYIRDHAPRRINVPTVARACGSARQRLERHFRTALGRTVLEEIRRARVEIAQRLLMTSTLELSQIAKQSGFSTAALLSVAFRREVGVPPGVYRRRLRGLEADDS